MSRMKCKHGRIGTECFECYRDLAHEYGKRVLQIAIERDELSREVSRLRDRIASGAVRLDLLKPPREMR